MFNTICSHKTNYTRGQIFPFMLAVLAVMLIMLMMTMNLGQISIYKTDTSNAADAGALAGASILSSSLLSLGLSNDALAGRAFTTLAIALPLIITIYAIAAGVGMLIAHTLKANGEYMQSISGSMMAWAQAKKTAMQYALQNSGVDEPRMSLARFARRAYDENIDTVTMQRKVFLQQVYDYGYDRSQPIDTQRGVYNAGRSGFGLFSSDDKGGWWRYGEITPTNHYVFGPLSTAYGWNNRPDPTAGGDDTRGYNSYDDGRRGTQNKGYSMIHYNGFCSSYDNAIFISVNGPSAYNIKQVSVLSDAANFMGCINDFIVDLMPDFLAGIVNWFLDSALFLFRLVFNFLDSLFVAYPTAFMLENEAEQIQKSAVVVTVRRHRKPSNRLGMWNFVYGGQSNTDVYSVSRGGLVDDRVEHDDDDDSRGCSSTLPSCCYTCVDGKAVTVNPFSNILCSLMNGDGWPENMWSSKTHLYEARILATE
jgi:hypothetical protein